MNKDDDLFVVIVGEESESMPQWNFDHNIEIKREVVEEDEVQIKVEKLLDVATEYGDVVELDEENFNIFKTELDDSLCEIKSDYMEYDYLEGNENYEPLELVQIDNDRDYEPSDHSDDDIPYSQKSNSSDDEYTNNNNKGKRKAKNKMIGKLKNKNQSSLKGRKRTHFWKGKDREIVSYIKYLRDLYTDLKNDEELLINCLVEVMKQTRRPEPPTDYYVMNGIMLECIHCGFMSPSIPAAHRHYQEKHGERYLYCYACGTDFRSTTNLYKHEKRCDAPDIKIVLKARALSLGRKGRSRPFLPDLSDIPPKKYYKSIRQYKCTECSASFVSKIGLQSHQRMHRGERPFVCAHCPCAYTSRTTLSRHMQKHGSQEYICDHCQRSFKIKGALILHLDTHAPLKKFPCTECPKRYSQKSALLVHINRDHRKLPHPLCCQICPKRYPRMSVLKEHMRKAHGMLIMTRKMFFKQLPVLTETQLQQAKVVLKTSSQYSVLDAEEH